MRDACADLTLRLRGPAEQKANVWAAGTPISQEVALDGCVQTITLPLGDIDKCADGSPLVVYIASTTALLDIDLAPWNVDVAMLEVQTRE
ncbi:MAG: hypothetical protein MI924_39600 [Chloroflexales bacterium]|nr:hypothetical protein [Chloroflexales bacterium]